MSLLEMACTKIMQKRFEQVSPRNLVVPQFQQILCQNNFIEMQKVAKINERTPKLPSLVINIIPL